MQDESMSWAYTAEGIQSRPVTKIVHQPERARAVNKIGQHEMIDSTAGHMAHVAVPNGDCVKNRVECLSGRRPQL